MNKDDCRKGRSVKDGYARGGGLQWGRLRVEVLADPLYIEAMRVVDGRSLVSEENRINTFLIITRYLRQIGEGNVIEFGSYKGGHALFMAYLLKKLNFTSRVYSCDTFSGMPDTDPSVDAHKRGDFSDVNFDELRIFAESNKLDNIEFVQGLFEETFPKISNSVGRISLAHIDCDIYSACAYAYNSVRNHMLPGGYIIFDDALYSSCLGATEVVEEFVIRRDGLHSEQIYPHYVFRSPMDS